MSRQAKPVLVTTAHRGVFYGRLAPGQDENDRTLVLEGCRNVIYWSGTAGFLGLAARGPEDGSTIGATAERVHLHDITSVTDCSAEAADRFESWP